MLYLLEKVLFADLQKFYFRKKLESVNSNFVSYKPRKSQKRLGPQMANPQIATFAYGSYGGLFVFKIKEYV